MNDVITIAIEREICVDWYWKFMGVQVLLLFLKQSIITHNIKCSVRLSTYIQTRKASDNSFISLQD